MATKHHMRSISQRCCTQLDNSPEKHVVEQDLWVKAGDLVHDFSGANETIGTFVLRFDTIEDARHALKHMDEYIKVIVE